MSNPFVTEPTFWTTSNAPQIGYNDADRTAVVVGEDGKRVQVRRPQGAHQGDYENPRRLPVEGVRYVTTVRHDGHLVAYTITAGAADIDAHSEYARHRKLKARSLGWFFWGACPCALLRAGQMSPRHIVDESLLEAEPCQHGTYSLANPCPHARAERAARMAKQSQIEIERERSYRAKNDKLVEAQRQQTEAIVKAQNDATQAIISQLAGGKKGKSE